MVWRYILGIAFLIVPVIVVIAGVIALNEPGGIMTPGSLTRFIIGALIMAGVGVGLIKKARAINKGAE